MCRIAGDSVTWKSLILFLGFREFGVIAQTREAGGVAQTRNYGVKQSPFSQSRPFYSRELHLHSAYYEPLR